MDSEEALIKDKFSKYLRHCDRRKERAQLSRFIAKHLQLILQTLPDISSEEELKRQWSGRFCSAVRASQIPASAWENDIGCVDWRDLALKKMEMELLHAEKKIGTNRKRKTVELFEREHEYVGKDLENRQLEDNAPESSSEKMRARASDDIDEFFNPSSPVADEEGCSEDKGRPEEVHLENAAPMDEIGVIFNGQPRSSRGKTSAKRTHCNSDTVHRSASSSNRIGQLLTEAGRREFQRKYEAMDNDYKWRLRSGRFVEDVLYKVGTELLCEDLAHSFAVNLSDSFVLSFFTKSEIEELENIESKSEPELGNDLRDTLESLNKPSTAEIREAIQALGARRGREYNFDKDFEVDTVAYGAESLLRLYEMTPNALTIPHNEHWYDIRLWGPLVDNAFADMEEYHVVRGESCSVASGERRERQRLEPAAGHPKQRKLIGHKGDMIIRKMTNGRQLEVGASEVGPTFDMEGAKWLHEGNLKLPKMLCDMFWQLCDHTGWDQDVMKKLEVVGYLHGGTCLMTMSVDHPSGYTLRLRRSPVTEVPSDPTLFVHALEVMVDIWLLKLRVKRSIELLRMKRSIKFGERGLMQSEKKKRLPGVLSTPER